MHSRQCEWCQSRNQRSEHSHHRCRCNLQAESCTTSMQVLLHTPATATHLIRMPEPVPSTPAKKGDASLADVAGPPSPVFPVIARGEGSGTSMGTRGRGDASPTHSLTRLAHGACHSLDHAGCRDVACDEVTRLCKVEPPEGVEVDLRHREDTAGSGSGGGEQEPVAATPAFNSPWWG